MAPNPLPSSVSAGRCGRRGGTAGRIGPERVRNLRARHQPMSAIHFGTDGWRAVIADQFTFANVERVTQATADLWRAESLPATVVIGYDRRFLSDQFARAAAEVFLGNGFKVVLGRAPTPTPAV